MEIGEGTKSKNLNLLKGIYIDIYASKGLFAATIRQMDRFIRLEGGWWWWVGVGGSH